ncbi:uncharacterized protein OCT59_007597 [Rhizophagus irregularis]|uniref:Uncharacterized protein n=1 Tax=Rhizophagus irregularis TaxID=588596 RepID=A0A916E0T7_9GLOM|nr:hypothetical protein OCT59_007597 [Rhizophagus irregularis]CAB5185195.1 unnamed protein product [Rhizophagus irregularis]CAB5322403.1 unnamed protein product [Rhizophagus irregularis]
MSRAIYTLIHIQIWTSSIWCPTQETRVRDKDSYNECVSGNKGGPIATIVIAFIPEVQILLSIIFLHPLIKVLHREINILVMETCKQVVARENNKTNNCKVGHVNNNCNENVGLSILNNGGVKDSRKLTAFERALVLSK